MEVRSQTPKETLSPELNRALDLLGKHVLKTKWIDEPYNVRAMFCSVCHNVLKSTGERKYMSHRRCLNRLLRAEQERRKYEL